jgi:hypothetical protein
MKTNGKPPTTVFTVQDGETGAVSFTPPAAGYPGIQIGGAPAMATFNNRLYIAFSGNDPSRSLFVTSSPDGRNFTTPARGYPRIQLGLWPAMTALGNRLYISFQANDPGHALFVTSSTDGVKFTYRLPGMDLSRRQVARGS